MKINIDKFPSIDKTVALFLNKKTVKFTTFEDTLLFFKKTVEIKPNVNFMIEIKCNYYGDSTPSFGTWILNRSKINRKFFEEILQKYKKLTTRKISSIDISLISSKNTI